MGDSVMNSDGGARVVEHDGGLVLIDPVAVGVFQAVGKHNCRTTAVGQAERVGHFMKRIAERGLKSSDVVIVLLNVDDENGAALAEILMPDHDWQSVRDRGEVPFARGLASRGPMQKTIELLDPEAAVELAKLDTAVVVMDHGVVAVFEAAGIVGAA